MIEIIDDFLTPTYFKQARDMVESHQFPWSFNNKLSNTDEDEGIIDSIERGPAIFFLAIGLVLISLTALYFGPGRVDKPFERRK